MSGHAPGDEATAQAAFNVRAEARLRLRQAFVAAGQPWREVTEAEFSSVIAGVVLGLQVAGARLSSNMAVSEILTVLGNNAREQDRILKELLPVPA